MQRFMLPRLFGLFSALLKKISQKNTQKFWRFKKLSYLCIAFSENGRLAQLVQSVCLTSRGSGVRIPQRPQNKKLSSRRQQPPQERDGRLAQLVQSVCLTSRGSGVRIPQRPLTNHYHCKTIQAVFLTKTAFFIIIFLPILIFVDNFDTN